MMDDNEPESKWHVDKNIPLALIFAMIGQTICIVWWAAGVSYRVGDLEQRLNAQMPNADRLTRLEAKSEYVIETLKEIKGLLSVRRPAQ